jgi:hypothetical protein
VTRLVSQNTPYPLCRGEILRQHYSVSKQSPDSGTRFATYNWHLACNDWSHIMSAAMFTRSTLATGLALAIAGAAAAQPPRGYRVESSGTFDRFPYPPAVGGQTEYWQGRRWVTLRDPFGSEMTMPLQPKVLYYDAAFVTPGGLYRPRSIALIPDDRPRPMPQRVRVIPPPTTFRYDGGPAVPVPPVIVDPPAAARNR